jgi:hypothetical protein
VARTAAARTSCWPTAARQLAPRLPSRSIEKEFSEAISRPNNAGLSLYRLIAGQPRRHVRDTVAWIRNAADTPATARTVA